MILSVPSKIEDILYEGPLRFDMTRADSPTSDEIAVWNQPRCIIGRPQWWNVANIYLRESSSLSSIINSLRCNRDIFLVRFSCSLIPGSNIPLDWARFSVRLHPINQEASEPIVLDLHPREVYQDVRNGIQVAVLPTLRFEETDARSGGVPLSLEYKELLSFTTAIGISEPKFSWDMETIKAPPLHGERWLHALISFPKDAKGICAILELVVDIITPIGIFRARGGTVANELYCLICS